MKFIFRFLNFLVRGFPGLHPLVTSLKVYSSIRLPGSFSKSKDSFCLDSNYQARHSLPTPLPLNNLDTPLPPFDSPVIPEVILSPERLAANITGIRPLVRVGPLVDEQIVRLGELSVAELADELFLGPGGPSGCPQ